MKSLLSVTSMLARGGTPVERARTRLTAAGAGLATWFLLGAANVLALHGHLNQALGPVSQPGTRGGTAFALGLLVLPVAAFLCRARTAETLLAARALEADARPWGRTLSVASTLLRTE